MVGGGGGGDGGTAGGRGRASPFRQIRKLADPSASTLSLT